MLKTLCISLALSLLYGCGTRINDPRQLDENSLDQVLEQIVDLRILPALDNFYDSSTNFEQAAIQFCKQVDPNSLARLQSAWKSASIGWYALIPYNFGPMDDDIIDPIYIYIDSYRASKGKDFSDTVRNDISNDLNASTQLTQSHFGNKASNRVGLLALELLSFEQAQSGSQKSEDIVAEYQFNERKCDLLKGHAAQVVKHAYSLKQGWHSVYKHAPANAEDQSYRHLFLSNQLDEGNNLTILLASIQDYLDHLKSRNVVNTTATVSQTAWSNISSSISEIESLLENQTDSQPSSDDNDNDNDNDNSNSTLSILAFMSAAGSDNAVALVRKHISDAHAAIAAQDSNMLDLALGNLDGNFKREIPDSLDIELGLNFNDGD